jgi:hypothetical protein
MAGSARTLDRQDSAPPGSRCSSHPISHQRRVALTRCPQRPTLTARDKSRDGSSFAPGSGLSFCPVSLQSLLKLIVKVSHEFFSETNFSSARNFGRVTQTEEPHSA